MEPISEHFYCAICAENYCETIVELVQKSVSIIRDNKPIQAKNNSVYEHAGQQ